MTLDRHDAAPVATDPGAVAYGVSRVLREVSRVCGLSTDAEAVEILSALSERFDPSTPAPFLVNALAVASDNDTVFPGIFSGATGGDFGGLPPVPGQVTARVPELVIRLSGLAYRIDQVLARDLDDDFAEATHDALAATAKSLHALADEITGEAGDQ